MNIKDIEKFLVDSWQDSDSVVFSTGKPGIVIFLVQLEQELGNTDSYEVIKAKVEKETANWPNGFYTVKDFSIYYGDELISNYLKRNNLL